MPVSSAFFLKYPIVSISSRIEICFRNFFMYGFGLALVKSYSFLILLPFVIFCFFILKLRFLEIRAMIQIYSDALSKDQVLSAWQASFPRWYG